MSEVDRVGSSGLYPALGMGQRRRHKDEVKQRHDSHDEEPNADADQTRTARTLKSIIDEYA